MPLLWTPFAPNRRSDSVQPAPGAATGVPTDDSPWHSPPPQSSAIAVLGIQVARQQDRIDNLAAEMRRDPMQQQAMAARSNRDAHVIDLASDSGTSNGEIAMLPDGTGYFMDHNLPALPKGSTYQLWAKVGDPASPRMVSLGVLGADPGIAAFRLSAPMIMFEVTREDAPGNTTPNESAVMTGLVS